jgi:hypothetical protein
MTRETCNRCKPGGQGRGLTSCSTNRQCRSQMHDMSLLLDKIIPLFVYPVGFAVAAGLVCLVFLAWGWRRAAATCIAVSTALRVASSNACGGSLAGSQS